MIPDFTCGIMDMKEMPKLIQLTVYSYQQKTFPCFIAVNCQLQTGN